MSNFVSLLFYLSAFAVATIFYYKGNRGNKRVYTATALAIPILISGFRYGVGGDFYTYLGTYNTYATLSIVDFYEYNGIKQIGYYLFNKLSFVLFDSHTVLFTAFACFTVVFFHKAIRKMNVKNPALLYFMFLLMVYPTSFNIMKQCLAISICVYAFQYFFSGNMKKYIGWIIVAFFFHSSAIILLLLCFVRKFFFIKKFTNLLITFAVGLFSTRWMFYVIENVNFLNKYMTYEDGYSGSINNYSFYLNAFVFVALLIFGRQLILKNENMVAFHFLTLSIVASILGFQSPFIARIGYYFSAFEVILLVNLTETFKEKDSEIIACVGIIAYALASFIITYYILGQSSVIPYQTMVLFRI